VEVALLAVQIAAAQIAEQPFQTFVDVFADLEIQQLYLCLDRS
jgi:hypothetical protein